MSFLSELFGASEDEVWQKIATELGGRFEDGGWLGTDTVRVRAAQWEITLDAVTSGDADSSRTWTRMRAPFRNKDGLRFTIYRETVLTDLGTWLGMQDIEVGHPFFDDAFVVKGNDPDKVRRLLDDGRLRRLLAAQPDVHLEVKDDEGWFGTTFPDGVDELYFECPWLVENETVLRSLFDLFICTLERLVQLDSAYPDPPGVRL
jgi:hypothetical protein